MKEIVPIFLAVFLFNFNATFAQDGTLDSTFGVVGKVWTDVESSESEIESVITQPDSKIIAAGISHNHGPDLKYFLIRYNIDGSRDNAFGLHGITEGYENSYIREILLQPDGKILGRGGDYSNHASFLVRYKINGTLDNIFGIGGILMANSSITSFCLQSNGKIVITEVININSNEVYRMSRYNPDGGLDTSFGVNGFTTLSGIGWLNVYPYPNCYFLALQSDGKILLTVTVGNHSTSDMAVVRYNTDGTLDTTFGTAGVSVINIDDSDRIRSLKTQNDGKIVLATLSSHQLNPDSTVQTNKIVRLLSNGNLDSTFGNSGVAALSFNPQSMQILGEKIIVCGASPFLGSIWSENDAVFYQIGLACYLSNGDLDPAFGNNGVILTPNEGPSENPQGIVISSSLALDSNNKMVVGATFISGVLSSHPGSVVLRYNSESGLPNGDYNIGKNAFTAYPNPVNQTLNLDFNLNQPAELSIDLFDSNGRKISNLLKEKNFQTGYHSQKLELPETLSKGIYFLNISNGSTASNVKIVK